MSMDERSIGGLLFVAVSLGCLIWWLSSRLRYVFLRMSSNNWPSAPATILDGPLGRISQARGFTVPAAFLRYTFVVAGSHHAGFFILYGAGAELRNQIVGKTLEIRYRPQSPDISFVADFHDSIFQGHQITQDPEWLDQAPAADLADSLRANAKRLPLSE